MKPGTLFALNQNLCLPLWSENRFRFTPLRTAPYLEGDAPDHGQPVLLARGGDRRPTEPAPSGNRSWLRRSLAAIGVGALVVLSHGWVLGWDRVAQARERHQLGRQIAAQEARAQELLLANRQITGQMLARNSALPRVEAAAFPSPPGPLLVRAAPALDRWSDRVHASPTARRGPRSGG